MKIILPVPVVVTLMVAVTLLEFSQQCIARPTSFNCDNCREVDIGDDEHNLCSFGCSFYLKTTLPADASDDVQRDIAHKILPILRFLRSFQSASTSESEVPELHTDIQFNHKTLHFEPVVHSQSVPVSVPIQVTYGEGSMLPPSESELPEIEFEHYDDGSDSIFPDLFSPHVLPLDSEEYDNSPVYSTSYPVPDFGLEVTASEPLLYSHTTTDEDENDEILRRIIMHLPATNINSNFEPQTQSETMTPQQQYNYNFHADNSMSIPFVPFPSSDINDENRPEEQMPPLPTVLDIYRYQLELQKEKEQEKEQTKEIGHLDDHADYTDTLDMLFVPLAQDKNVGTIVTSVPQQQQQEQQQHQEPITKIQNSIDLIEKMELEDQNMNEIPDEEIDEMTKSSRIIRKPSLLDMYYVEDGSLVESKRVKKD